MKRKSEYQSSPRIVRQPLSQSANNLIQFFDTIKLTVNSLQ